MPLLDIGIFESSGGFLSCVLLFLESDKIGEDQRLGVGVGVDLRNRGDLVFPYLYLHPARNDLYGDDADGDHGSRIAVGKRGRRKRGAATCRSEAAW